jgi:hypothetical protein
MNKNKNLKIKFDKHQKDAAVICKNTLILKTL